MEKNSENTIYVDVDTDPADVLKYSLEGKTLRFADEAGKFLELSSEVVKGLRHKDQNAYFIAYGAHRMAMEEQEMQELGLKATNLTSATSRLEVEGKDPGKHYCWKRPDELRQAGYKGYRLARGANLRSFGGGPGTTHRVGALGEDELVLMEMPKDKAEELLAEPAKRSRQKVKNFDAAAKEELGRNAFNSEGARAGGQFTPTR